MGRTMIITGILTITISLTSFVYAEGTHSGEAIKESGQASTHASKGSVHSVLGSAQVTSGVSAVPFAASGAAGAVSTEIADELMEAATAPIGTPLEITDETITVGPPPDEALAPQTSADN